jgi:hypothetical protein
MTTTKTTKTTKKSKATALTQCMIWLATHTFETLPIALLVENLVQPVLRTTDGALRELKAKVAETGFITPITVLYARGTYFIINGHRRLAVALALGLTSIECVVRHYKKEYKTVEDAAIRAATDFVDEAAGERAHRGCDSLCEWAKLPDANRRATVLSHMRPHNQRRIRDLVDYVGEATLVKIVAKHPRITPTVEEYIGQAVELFSRYTPLSNSKVNKRRVAIWVMTQRMSSAVCLANGESDSDRRKTLTRMLYDAFEENRRPTNFPKVRR